MIHASFLGDGFEKRVTDQCYKLSIPAATQGTWQPLVLLAIVLLLGHGQKPHLITGIMDKSTFWMVMGFDSDPIIHNIL